MRSWATSSPAGVDVAEIGDWGGKILRRRRGAEFAFACLSAFNRSAPATAKSDHLGLGGLRVHKIGAEVGGVEAARSVRRRPPFLRRA